MDAVRYAVIASATLLLGVFIGRSDNTETLPECRTEDACDVDYHDGGWYITEDPYDVVECDTFEGDEVVCIESGPNLKTREVESHRVTK